MLLFSNDPVRTSLRC